jgi:hypothetical protein
MRQDADILEPRQSSDGWPVCYVARMATRSLSLLLIALLAWLPAQGTRQREDLSEHGSWSAAPATPARPAGRFAHLRSVQRTFNVRTADRHVPAHDPTLVPDEASALAMALPERCRAAELASSCSGARALAFPYDATAPPAGV